MPIRANKTPLCAPFAPVQAQYKTGVSSNVKQPFKNRSKQAADASPV
nr:MAG TPA: hypothetical protein [Caudoviricetes sp.]